MTSFERQNSGFHTFLMTGDAIINTSFNPFKPSRQLPRDPEMEHIKVEQISNQPQVCNLTVHSPDSPVSSDSPVSPDSIANECGAGSPDQTSVEEKSTSTITPKTLEPSELETHSPLLPPDNHYDRRQFLPGFVRVECKDEQVDASNLARHNIENSICGEEFIDADARFQQVHSGSSPSNGGTRLVDGYNEIIDVTDQHGIARVQVPTNNIQSSSTALIGEEDQASRTSLLNKLCRLDGYTKQQVTELLINNSSLLDEYFNLLPFHDDIVDYMRVLLRHVEVEKDSIYGDKILSHFASFYLASNGHSTLYNFCSHDQCLSLVRTLIRLNVHLSKTSKEKLAPVSFMRRYCSPSLIHAIGAGILERACASLIDRPLTETTRQDSPFMNETENDSQFVTKQADRARTLANRRIESILQKEGYMFKKVNKGIVGKRWKKCFVQLDQTAVTVSEANSDSEHAQVLANFKLFHAAACADGVKSKSKSQFTITRPDGEKLTLRASNENEMKDWIQSINLSAALTQSNARFDDNEKHKDWSQILMERCEDCTEYAKRLNKTASGFPDLSDQQQLSEKHVKQEECEKQIMRLEIYAQTLKQCLDQLNTHTLDKYHGLERQDYARSFIDCSNDWHYHLRHSVNRRMSYRQAIYGESFCTH